MSQGRDYFRGRMTDFLAQGERADDFMREVGTHIHTQSLGQALGEATVTLHGKDGKQIFNGTVEWLSGSPFPTRREVKDLGVCVRAGLGIERDVSLERAYADSRLRMAGYRGANLQLHSYQHGILDRLLALDTDTTTWDIL